MLFEIKTSKERDTALLQKTKLRNTNIIPKAIISMSTTGGAAAKIAAACAVADSLFAKYANQYKIVTEIDELEVYLKEAQRNEVLAIDTETGGLNPIDDEIAGGCFYTPGQKGIYVPVGHYSYITGQRVMQQMQKKDLAKLLNSIKVKHNIFHNSKFDCRVLHNQLQVTIEPFWDTYIASRLLNENEESHSLKPLHKKYINPDMADYKFDTIFEGVKFNFVPIKSGYIYAARDPHITYELYEFQKKHLNKEKQPKIYNLFERIEMPLVPVVCKMEDEGVELDTEIVENLRIKYEKQLEEVNFKLLDSLQKYNDKIKAYYQQFRGKSECKLSNPINLSSPTQVAILLYDILGLQSPDKRSPRGTGEEILEVLVEQKPELNLLLEMRGIKKLLSTYINKMPKIVSKDGKVRCSFNQVGAATGRFTSSDPNMQNIPSKNEEIRTMFKAPEGMVFISCDYSQQEPRILAHLSGDESLRQAYREGKDLYAYIASLCFKKPYEQCLEFNADKTVNKEGKKLRGRMKVIVLAITYGKEAASVAKDLGIKKVDAEELFDLFFRMFPGVRKYMLDTQQKAIDLGYVETMEGRKRRLPDMQLPAYDISYIEDNVSDILDFNLPLDTEFPKKEVEREVQEDIYRMLNRCRFYKEKAAMLERIKEKYNVEIIDNTKKLSDATRQCVNSEIQGSAADMFKRALLAVARDKKLISFKCFPVLPEHDEMVCVAPKDKAQECARLIEKNMISVANLVIPMKCDVSITNHWNGKIVEEYKRG